MSHRWSILGFTNAFTALIAGQFLDRVAFPLNYQIFFTSLSIGGIISFYFSSKIIIPDNPPRIKKVKTSFKEQAVSYLSLIYSEKPFVSFIWKRFCIFIRGCPGRSAFAHLLRQRN